MIAGYLELWMYDKHKKLILHKPRWLMQSFVKNFYNLYIIGSAGITCSAANDTDLRGVDGTVDEGITQELNMLDTDCWRGVASAPHPAAGEHGILVGSSDAAENFGMGSSPGARSYSLGARIVHGTGAGQLQYTDMAAGVVSKTGGTPNTYSVLWRRYVTNNSGGNVTINEIGVYSTWFDAIGDANMICRDKLISPVVMADGSQLKIDYTTSIAFPS
jgi:hypothetical protein